MTKKVLPFKGIVYNQDKINSLADVVTPPYDVINAETQSEFYERSPFNFCRLDLPKETGDDRYQVAKEVMESWVEQDVLKTDDHPGIYVHHHSFTLPDGRNIVRKGFFAARRIEDFSEGGIKPHEKTLDGPKADRLNMTRATKTNLSPVFSLYSDPDQKIQELFDRLIQTTPAMDFISKDNERHQVWKLTNQDACDAADAFLSERPLFIADGHHRYETALNYRNELAEDGADLSDDSASKFLLMYFSNLNDDGMVILPIHRAIHSLPDFSFESFLEKLSVFFDVKQVDSSKVNENLENLEVSGKDAHAYWILTKDPTKSYMITLDRQKWLESDLAQGISETLVGLDVKVLHTLILNHILGITDEAQAKQENLIYWKSTERAIAETQSGNCDFTFILNPTRVQDVQNVALAGEKMPQKSTFFYPKIVSGLVLHAVGSNIEDGVLE